MEEALVISLRGESSCLSLKRKVNPKTRARNGTDETSFCSFKKILQFLEMFIKIWKRKMEMFIKQINFLKMRNINKKRKTDTEMETLSNLPNSHKFVT